jgi:short subunit dehydrogenase-like uncharacterized protein
MGPVMVYGATGFSGRPIAERLCEAGHDVVVAGRSETKVRELAGALDAPSRVFGLEDPAEIALGLRGIGVVVHAAGPFLDTAAPMIEGCARTGAHYLDLSGEWPVFAFAQRLGPLAAEAGVMLMPGVGYLIVISDCLAAYAATRVPEATLLRIAVAQPPTPLSRGTFRSALDLMASRVIVRRCGAVRAIPLGDLRRSFNFGAGERASLGFSWPDVITGQHTTGIANIEAYVEAPAAFRLAWRFGAQAAQAFGDEAFRAASAPMTALWPERPSAVALGRSSHSVVVEAVDPWRRATRFGVRTADGYSVTTATATAVVERVLAGAHAPGFQTPAGLFGAVLMWDLDCASLYDAA